MANLRLDTLQQKNLSWLVYSPIDTKKTKGLNSPSKIDPVKFNKKSLLPKLLGPGARAVRNRAVLWTIELGDGYGSKM